MRFAHMGDCHIGAWRDEKLRYANTNAFDLAINRCIDLNVDFILISGDLFDTSLPSIDHLKTVAKKLKLLKDKHIPVYIIAGSHDYSPSGRTMIEVLEKAGLCVNIFKGEIKDKKLSLRFTTDEKTGAKIAGIIGKKGMLDKQYYEDLSRENLEQEQGFKIFMLHTALNEFKPKELERISSIELSSLPKNFNYYAAGHVHYVFNKQEQDYGTIAYPGPIFPTNFREIELLGNGGFYVADVETVFNQSRIKLEYEKIKLYNVFCMSIPCNGKNPKQVEEIINEKIKSSEFYNTIVTIRLHGTLESGKPTDINFKDIFSIFYKKGAYFVMKSLSMLNSKEFDESVVETKQGDDVDEMVIEENPSGIKTGMKDEKETVKRMIQALDKEKGEDELVKDFESRITEEVDRIMNQ